MSERSASSTAVAVAFHRAAHQTLDAEPRLLDDPVTVRLLGDDAAARVRADPRHATPGALALRSHVALRSRFAEDRMAGAVARGVDQVVVLGAGLDTFAYRQPPWAAAARVFEVDHPASQAAKREAIARAGVAVPPNVTFVPVDFERVSLRDGLAAGGVDLARPAFFSWLGVTMYLTESAVDAVFRTVAALPAPTEIAFTFALPFEPGDPARAFADWAAANGEPWLTFYAPETLEARLRTLGFSDVDFLTPEAAAPYFAGRTDGLPGPRRTTICSARV